MEKKELIKELEKEFQKMKKDLNFKSTFEELNRIFFISDSVLKDGFVSENLSRQVSYRIVETFMGWNDYLHSIIMPNPQNILNMSESKIFNQEEKKEIIELMKKNMEISSRNSIIGLTKDKKAEAVFIDKAVKFWNEEFKPKMIKIMKKVNKEWSGK
jgi:hypothetical protein